jgi:eukaryotic-like serine/threonine-protein kinase
MPLGPEDWPRAREVFERALELPSGERLAYVAGACGRDGALRGEVERMLASHRAAPDFLATPAAMVLDETRESLSLEGQRIGPYLLSSRIGAGGMGVVYKARDTRLDRTVAIKVLPAESSSSAHARERFEREARAVAALNHPHICTLFDVGEAPIPASGSPQPSAISPDLVRFLVMEHLDGETLSARLARGPLPLDRAMVIAVQIASALDTAHRAGIVHRDLKPGNVMLTKTGAKLLDFGLAKATGAMLGRDPTRAPSALDLTIPGTILGTVQYMAPEQIEGKEADARSDIFAFGAVLYEMVAGRKAFEGASEASVMAVILEREPPALSTLQPLAPPMLDRIVTACLAKDPDDRWQTARDLLRELTWVRDGEAVPRETTSQRTDWRTRAVLPLAAALATAALSMFAIYVVRRPAAEPPPRVMFSIYPPDGTRFPRGTADMALSPDGSRLVFAALSADGNTRLWVRRLDSSTARPLDGTEGATYPFWAPDSRSIAFFAQGKLKRIAEAGGSPQFLCDAASIRGGTWNNQGTILIGGFNGPIQRVADTGGTPSPVTSVDQARQERSHVWPVFLPDGQRFVYLARSDDRERMAIYQGSLDSREVRHVLAADSNVGLAGGYLMSLQQESLVAHAYDPDRATVVGEPVTIADHMALDTPLRSGSPFTVARGTVLAYRSASPDSHLVWFDRTGKVIGAFRTPGDYHHPWLSPDERRVAIERTDPATGQHTIWILDLARQTTSRLVADIAGSHEPVWSPDGRYVAFNSNRAGGFGDLYWTEADGGSADELILKSIDRVMQIPTDWSVDGRLIVYDIYRPSTKSDLYVLAVSPLAAQQRFLETPANETQGQFSPDARWIAYTSNESGAYEVYVRRFPGAGGKWQVSTNGGAQPRWRRDGKELFYLAPDGRLMAADVKATNTRFETGTPRVLFNTGITASFVDRRNQYVVTRDGQRFLVNISAEDENSAPITVVLNWQAPPKK